MDGEQVAWAYWGGEMMGSLVAFDTETVASPDIDRKSPELVLATASDGAKTFVIRREDVPEFLLVNGGAEFVGHNVAFDFWVVLDWLEGLSHSLSRQVWWEVFDSGRAHDTMLLDQLVRLAKGDWAKGGVKPRNLEEVSLQYCPGHAANKEMGGEDPYRMRFGELLGVVNWGLMDPGFFDYAARDALATYHAYLALKKEAEALQSPWVPGEGEERYACYPDCVGRFGPLTEAVQVKGSVALRGVTLRGMCVDRDYALALDKEYRDKIEHRWDFLLAHYPGWFKYQKKTGALVKTPKGNFYATQDKELKKVLAAAAGEAGIDPPQSKGKLGGISTSEKAWSPYTDKHPFLGAWVEVERSKSILKFFDVFRKLPPSADGQYRVHPGYITLKNTGRTGCSGKDRKKGGRGYDYPNVQQAPKIKGFREIYVASPGHKLLTIDFSAIELRTLAAVCYSMFGSSVLGDVIKGGRDPHAYTSAMISGVSYEEFLSWKESNPKKFKGDRQSAKALNFGIPGGLGPRKLVEYARSQYGVKMSEEEAAAFRTKLITEVYPEIGKYLESDPVLDVSRSLRLHPGFVREAVEGTFGEGKVGKGLYLVGRVAQGFPYYKGGDPYPAPLVIKASRLLCDLLEVSRRHDLLSLFESRPASWKEYAEGAGKRVYREVFGTTAVTLTGRVRKGCGYTDGKNTPFQSLAADGAKLALWELCKRGARVVAFVHDEVIVEVPEASAGEDAKVVEEVMCGEMGKALGGLVPVACEWHLAREWKK